MGESESRRELGLVQTQNVFVVVKRLKKSRITKERFIIVPNIVV